MLDRDLEHPDITAAERTGYPTGRDRFPICPCCGEECEHVYREFGSDHIIGCDQCLIEEDAWETEQCFPEN